MTAGEDGRAETVERARETFRRGLERGDYHALLDRRLAALLDQAATQRGLADEIGALRFVLKRLLAEEDDVTRLAAGVARVTGVAIRAAQAERALAAASSDRLSAALAEVLAELDDE